MKAKKYVYRDHMGATRLSLKAFTRHYPKIGNLLYIRGYVDGVNPWTRVAIVGDRGRMVLIGFCWGYGGEGPRGLKTILTNMGVSEQTSELIAFGTHNPEQKKHECWRLTKTGEGFKIDLRIP